MTPQTVKKYVDLKIVDDDLALNSDGIPEMVCNVESIVQDVCHAVRESGHLVLMIGERNSEKRGLQMQKIIIVVEDDERIIPGTVAMYEMFIQGTVGRWGLTGNTYEFGNINLKAESKVDGSYTIKSG